jgi:serine/threonine protein phosphatase PrpC
MGDYFLLHVGLSHEPTIVKTDLKDVSAILLASDGLWDNWKKRKRKRNIR